MIKILIIEDEIPARKKLRRFIEELNYQLEIVAEIDNVTEALSFLKSQSVDLIFSDIELLDGNAFEIYAETKLSCPIIFTTAYDQFWMDAFDSNGIAYLLKPFSRERFLKAWDKFVLFRGDENNNNESIVKLTRMIEQSFARTFKKRFTVQTHRGIYFVDTENITFFEASEGVIFAHDLEGKKHLLSESTLKEIESVLCPADFFRINRGELIAKPHIEKVERFTKNNLAIKVKGCSDFLTTSQGSTAIFRDWISQ